MVYIDIKHDGPLIICDCRKNTKDGEYFQLVFDSESRQLIKKPSTPDIDASAAYSRVSKLLASGNPLPEHTTAEWG